MASADDLIVDYVVNNFDSEKAKYEYFKGSTGWVHNSIKIKESRSSFGCLDVSIYSKNKNLQAYIYRSKYPKLAKLYYECVEKYRKDKERHALEEAQSFFKNMI